MKKISSIFALLMVAVMVLTACGTPATTPPAPTQPPATQPPATEAPTATQPPATATQPPVKFRVGFVTDTGGIDDKSFNQTQWEGVLRAQTDLGIEAKFIQSDEASQYTPNLTEFASQGYDLVIASGFFLGADLAKVAAQYPDIKFSIVDYAYPDPFGVPEGVVGRNECIPNVMGQVFKTDQAAYLAGYLAAGMTKTGKIAYYGGAKIPSVTIFGVGFQQGMEAYNAAHGTKVVLLGWDNKTGEGSFTGDFGDLTKAKQAATSLYDEGADIVMGVGGIIGIPSFALARERGGYGIWVDTDGYVRFPDDRDIMLTSIMKKMDQAQYDLIKTTMDGKFAGCTNYVGDMVNGGVDIADYHDLSSKVPEALKAEIAALKAKIISGELKDTGCISFPNSCPGGLYTP
jgi:basic membrane protein A